MADTRIPPAVTFAFERFVADVCNKAKIDTDDWPLRARELLSHLQERWREGVDQGLNDADAQERAFSCFGTADEVAGRLRESWFHRLLYYRRYKVTRCSLFLCGSLVATMLAAMSTSGYQGTPMAKEGDSYLYGTFLNGFWALGSAWAIAWQPKTQLTWLRLLLGVRYVLGLLVLSGIVNAVLMPVIIFGGAILQLKTNPGALKYGLAALPSIALSVVGVLGLIAECFNFPLKRRRLTPEQVAFQLIR